MESPETGRVAATEPPADVRHKAPLGLKTVALFELLKGVLFVIFAVAALFLVHKDLDHLVDDTIRYLHLDPAWHFTKLLLNSAGKLNDAELQKIAVFAILLAAIRIAEAYGLWHEKAWAEWFAVVSAGIYLPWEMTRYWKNPTVGGAVVFLANIAIVIYLAKLLHERHQKKVAARLAETN